MAFAVYWVIMLRFLGIFSIFFYSAMSLGTVAGPRPNQFYEVKLTTMPVGMAPECKWKISTVLSDAEKKLQVALCNATSRWHYVTYMEFIPLSDLELKSNSKSIEEQIDSANTFGTGIVASMFLLPSELSGVDIQKEVTSGQWTENQTSAPEFDNGGFTMGSLGSGYLAGSFYVAARHNGSSHMEAFGYTSFVSSVIWQYGTMTAVQKPTWQDLFATPIIGTLLGVQLFRMHSHIEGNGGRLWGSKALGKAGLALSDPIDSMEDFLEHLGGDRYRVKIQLGLGTIETPSMYVNRSESFSPDDNVGLQFKLRFGKKH